MQWTSWRQIHTASCFLQRNIFRKTVRNRNSFLLQHVDFNYDNSSMQTSAMILLCSVLVLICIFVSSIFVWKWVLRYEQLNQHFLNIKYFPHRHKRRSKDSLPYKTSSSTGSPMDPSIVFNGYENPDAFSLRYKVLERQQNHFDVSSTAKLLYNQCFSFWEVFSGYFDNAL